MNTSDYPDIQLHIDGVWCAGSGPERRTVINPADASVLGEFAEASESDLERALQSAQRGLTQWKTVPPIQRADILNRAAALLRERAESIAALASLEEGQPFNEGKAYIQRAAEIIEWEAAEGRRIYGRVVPSEPGLRLMVLREPVGVVAAFTPWNAPVFTPCRKIASVLAAGCSLILKAAEETPASTAAVVQAFLDAGVPAGVLQLVYGNPAMISNHLIRSPIVRLITFTGSVAIGKQLAQMAAAEMKPSVMELGGHAPVIVCEDADIEDAARKLAAVKYRNAGQACLSPSRFWVARAAYDAFVNAFVEVVEQLRLGAAFDHGVTMGPLANARRLAAVAALVDDAIAQGATRLAGARRRGDQGYFYEPTVLGAVPDAARIMSEEPFGPVAVVNAFDELDEVIARANSTRYGLASYAFTRSSSTADKLIRELECGTIGINNLTVSTTGIPFGGVKDSGFGREGGTEGVESYTVAKSVSHLHV